MKYEKIESHDKIEVGKTYWLRSKQFGSFHAAECKKGLAEGQENTILGHWVDHNNHAYAFAKYDIFGPIPTPTIETIYLCEKHGGYGFISDCAVCQRFKVNQQPAGQE